MIVALDDDVKSVYLKITITFEVSNYEVRREINEKNSIIKDICIIMIGNKNVPEIVDQSGKEELKSEMIAKLNKYLVKGKINRIFFVEFVLNEY